MMLNSEWEKALWSATYGAKFAELALASWSTAVESRHDDCAEAAASTANAAVAAYRRRADRIRAALPSDVGLER